MINKPTKVAVLGSGVMGSRIACHFANIGLEVLLLDISPRELNDQEKKKGLELNSKAVRNRIVDEALTTAIKSNPAPLYSNEFANRISTGNFDDDLSKISDCDWIIEAIIENLEIKQSLYEKVEKVRKPGTLISSNTSGIPISHLAEGRSEDFQKHFCGTHFFNPPRYLKLLEVIPGPKTDKKVLDFFMDYGDQYLGKTTVFCKDTPAFIANRVGVFSMLQLLHGVKEMDMSIEEVDKLTGPVLGRPKSATFRTADVVGLDTFVNVAKGLQQNLPKDERKTVFELPEYIQKMLDNKWLGSKTGQGFYKKVKHKDGSSEIQVLDLKSLEYKASQKAKFPVLELTKAIDKLEDRIPVLFGDKGKAGEFYRKNFFSLFSYVSLRIPEIADDLFSIDDALRAGFGWQLGPFETWDAYGVEKSVAEIEKAGFKVADWVKKMLKDGHTSFYKVEKGTKHYYDVAKAKYLPIPGTENYILLDVIRGEKVIWKNSDASLFDLGDGILNLEFHSKMNSMGSGVIEAINHSISYAEKEARGLVVANNGQNFSVGANLGMILMMAAEQEWDELHFAVSTFQNTMMRARFSSIPVVVAPHQMALGGGCELSLHADMVIPNAETYTGLVEFGAGIIPAGGGSKEFTLRASDELKDGGIDVNTLKNHYLTIAMAKVGRSAEEAFELGIYVRGRDQINMNKDRQITEAKSAALQLADAGYKKPVMRKNIKVLGREALGMFFAGANTMKSGNYISDHDKLISEKLAYVMCGGDLSEATNVSEQYLLDLEREAFVSLCGERKTLERMQHLLQTGKPLRN